MATLEESNLVPHACLGLPRSSKQVTQQNSAASILGPDDRGFMLDAPHHDHQHSTESDSVDSEAVIDNLRYLLPLVSLSDSENHSTSKRVRHLNDLAKVIKHVGHVIDPYYPVENVIDNVRLALLSGVKEVRAGALRVLRYLLSSSEVFSVMLRYRVDILVSRSLDVPPVREIERLQAMRFVRQAISVTPHSIPPTLVAPMVAIVLLDSEPHDNLIWSCMATLSELAMHNPELAAKTGAIKALLRGLLKCPTFRICEAVILTLSFLLNRPCSRKFIRSQLDMESLLAPITDLHFRYFVEDVDKTLTRHDNELRIEASKMTLVAMLKSWPGLFCLGSPKNSGISSLLSMLPLAEPPVQREILKILYSVFQLKVPQWTDSFSTAIASVDPSEPKAEWSLSEGWVAEEGRDLLPPKTVGRTNLVDCYHSLLLATLMEAGLMEYLVAVVRSADNHVTVMATILLGKLLHMANTILPPEFSRDSHCLPELITSAMAFDTQEERHRASEIISCLDRVHQMKKKAARPSSLYLKLILEQAGHFVGYRTTLDRELLQCMPTELDEVTLSGLVKDTGVLATKEYMKWNWNLIFSLLQHPGLRNSQLLEDALFGKFIKRLCAFYKPSNHLYAIVPYSETSSRRYSSVGQQLVKYLCHVEVAGPKGTSGFLVELVNDIVAELGQVTASKLTADVFSATSVGHKLAKDYFLLLGTVSFHKVALLTQCKAYGPFLDICNYQNRSDLMKLIIATMDFGHDTHSRVILSKILTATDRDMRLYATQHMRVLLRAKVPFFNSWGLELLIPQLYDLDKQIALETVDILDEACEEESFLEALVLQQPALLHLGEKGAALFTRFIAVKRGFALMSRLGFLDTMLERWYKDFNTLYVYIVEERLAEALTSYKQIDEGEFIRRSNTNKTSPKAFVPVHFYGQLVQHEEGCARLDSEGHVKKFAEAFRKEPLTSEDILNTKAVVWALGHVGSSPGGLELLMKEDIIGELVEMAEESPVLSLRGTCFYAICLISKTPGGANVLLDEGWTTVRHSVEEKWPLLLDSNLEAEEGTFLLSPDLSPVRTFPPLFGSFDFQGPKGTLPKASSFAGGFTHPVNSHEPLGRHSSDNVPKVFPTSPTAHKGISPRAASRRNRKFIVSVKEPRRSPSLMKLFDKRGAPLRGKGLSSKQPRPSSISAGELLGESQPFSKPNTLPHLRNLTRSVSGSRQRPLASTGGGANYYIGVCLPLEITCMFEYDEGGFESRVVAAPTFDPEALTHDRSQCLECMLTMKTHCSSISSEMLHHITHAASTGSLSPDVRSRAHTGDSSSTGSGTSVGLAVKGSGGGKRSSSKSPEVSPSVESAKSDGDRKVVNGSSAKDGEGGEGGRMGRDRTSGERKGQKSRSPSPLIRMKRVESDDSAADVNAVGEHKAKESDSAEQLREEEAQELKASSVEGSSLASGKEEMGSQSSKGGIVITVVGSSVSEGGPKSSSDNTTEDSASVASSNTQSMGLDEGSAEGRRRLHQGILDVIYSLSSDVSLRKNTMGLSLICQRFPSVVQDVCLYSKVVEMLCTYNYSLSTRRFVQSKFEKMTFATLFAARPSLEEELCEEDLISSGTSSRRESISSADIAQPPADFDPKYRRRSSTSDVTKIRQLGGIRVCVSHEESEEVPNGTVTDEGNTNANNSVKLEEVDAPRGDNHVGMRERALQVQARSVDGRISMIMNVAYDL